MTAFRPATFDTNVKKIDSTFLLCVIPVEYRIKDNTEYTTCTGCMQRTMHVDIYMICMFVKPFMRSKIIRGAPFFGGRKLVGRWVSRIWRHRTVGQWSRLRRDRSTLIGPVTSRVLLLRPPSTMFVTQSGHTGFFLCASAKHTSLTTRHTCCAISFRLASANFTNGIRLVPTIGGFAVKHEQSAHTLSTLCVADSTARSYLVVYAFQDVTRENARTW